MAPGEAKKVEPHQNWKYRNFDEQFIMITAAAVTSPSTPPTDASHARQVDLVGVGREPHEERGKEEHDGQSGAVELIPADPAGTDHPQEPRRPRRGWSRRGRTPNRRR